ncbi:MAG: glycosyltransferase family 1 protein [Bacteroidales bacterium]
MSDNHLHIISFNVPFPPNYGGVIDVFYKIKALHSLGIKIHLHCFEYGRNYPEELSVFCECIYYYKRKTNVLAALFLKPYIVASRKSDELIQNLLKDDFPILFEGLHSCYYLNDKRLMNRMKIFRESNIEHLYYFNLFRSEKKIFSKLYFFIASCKLRLYQHVLKHADLMLIVSQNDTNYFLHKFDKKRIVYLPSFHPNSSIQIKPGKGDYVLYHGNLSVPENEFAASFLMKEIFNNLNIPLKIAGLHPDKSLQKLSDNFNNVELIANPDEETMMQLVQNAQINILVTFQATGLKLKLLNTLYNGRFCLVNNKMLAGTGLDSLCEIADTSEKLKEKILQLYVDEFDKNDIVKRETILYENYSNEINAKKIINLIFR